MKRTSHVNRPHSLTFLSFKYSQITDQCDQWMSLLDSKQKDVILLNEIAMENATAITDNSCLLKFRYNASQINGELSEEIKELRLKVNQLRTMLSIQASMGVAEYPSNVLKLFHHLRLDMNAFLSDFEETKKALLQAINLAHRTKSGAA